MEYVNRALGMMTWQPMYWSLLSAATSCGGSLIYYSLKNILALSSKPEIGCIGRKKSKEYPMICENNIGCYLSFPPNIFMLHFVLC